VSGVKQGLRPRRRHSGIARPESACVAPRLLRCDAHSALKNQSSRRPSRRRAPSSGSYACGRRAGWSTNAKDQQSEYQYGVAIQPSG